MTKSPEQIVASEVKKRFRAVGRAISTLSGFLLLGFSGYVIFVTLRGALKTLASLDSDIAVAIIAAAATAFVSVLSLTLGKAYEARAAIRQDHREKKVPVYEDLIQFMFRVLMGVKTGDAPSEEETLKFMMDFNQRIMVWGADEVLTAWVRWRRIANKAEAQPARATEIMLAYEDLILAIRKDLGHKNADFNRGDILSLFITDIDSLL